MGVGHGEWVFKEKEKNCGFSRLLVRAWQVMFATASASHYLPHDSIFVYDKHADACRILRGADGCPFCLGWQTGRGLGVGVVGQGVQLKFWTVCPLVLF